MLISNNKSLKRAKIRHSEYYGMTEVFDRLYSMSKSGKCFVNLMNIIRSSENIKLAYRNIKANSGSSTPGVDGKTIEHVGKMSESRYVEIVQSKLHHYKPNPVRRVEIPKANGKMRPLGIPTIWDRLVQQSILQVLEPICEAKFHERNNGFRPNRSVENAMAQCYKMINQNHLYYVVDIDIKGFFDNVNHSKLKKQLWTLGIRDKQLICIISEMLKAPVCMQNGETIYPTKGTPQGGILSPLLANVVLNELDWWITSQWEQFPSKHLYKGKKNEDGSMQQSSKYQALRKTHLKEMFIVRYADDFKIFCRTYDEAKRAYEGTKQWLQERLKLDISDEKSKIVDLRTNYSDFLGFRFKAISKKKKLVVKSHVSDKALRNITANLKKQIEKIRTPSDSNDEVFQIRQYNTMVLGYHNYFRIATMVSEDFDQVHSTIRVVLKNRIGNRMKRNGTIYNSIIAERYGKSARIRFIRECPLIPVGYVQHKNPMYKNKKICMYTPDGREEIHRKLGINHGTLMKLMNERNTNRSIAYMDNRVSLFCAQQGKCAILGVPLDYDDIHCHHKNPRSKGGTDEYRNLIIIHKMLHVLIHATKPETIERYQGMFHLNKNQIKKINRLREKIGIGTLSNPQ